MSIAKLCFLYYLLFLAETIGITGLFSQFYFIFAIFGIYYPIQFKLKYPGIISLAKLKFEFNFLLLLCSFLIVSPSIDSHQFHLL